MSAPDPIHPLAILARPGRIGAAPATGAAALTISLPRRDLVQVLARRGQTAALGAALEARFGVALPGPGQAAAGRDATAIWVQQEGWMLSAPRGPEGDFAARVAAALAGLAAVEDQTHGRTTIRLAGPGARAVLARGCRVDLHPRVFGPGRAISTPIAHVGCLVHQTDDAPCFELTVFSTFAETVFDWLVSVAAEIGAEIA